MIINYNKHMHIYIYLPLEMAIMAIIQECKFHIFSDGQRMQLAIVCSHWAHWAHDSVFSDAAAVAHGEWRWVTWFKGRMTRFRTSWFLRDEINRINIQLTEDHFREGKVYRHSVCWTWPCCQPRGSAMSPPMSWFSVVWASSWQFNGVCFLQDGARINKPQPKNTKNHLWLIGHISSKSWANQPV